MTPQRFASGRFGGVARLPGHQVGRMISNLFGGGSAQELLDSAPFCSELLYTAIPQRAASGTTGTFTRATTSTWQNNDGYLVTGLAGEIGFPGARRVRNLLTFTENFSNAAWSTTAPGGGSITLTTGVSDPFGTTRATTWTRVGGTDVVGKFQSVTTLTGNKYLNSIYLKRRTGTGAVYLRTINNVNVDVSGDLSSTEWLRIDSGTVAVSGTTGYFVLTLGTAGDAIDVFGAQLEDVTAQTTQTAGEYVSVGVESAPYYHGSFVDGVKCFPTDLSGNPLTTMERYKPEAAATNLQRRSRFDQKGSAGVTAGWMEESSDAVNANVVVTLNSGPSIDGTTKAAKIANNADNARHATYYYDPVVTAVPISANTTYAVSFDLWPGTATRARVDWVIAGWTSGCYADVDMSTGVIYATGTYGTGTYTASTISPITGGGYRVTLAGKVDAATIVGYATVSVLKSDGTLSYVGGGEYLYADRAQVEAGSMSTSFIETTSAAVTRNADILDYSSGDIPNIVWLAAGVKRESGVNGVGVIAELHDGTQNEDLYAFLSSATNIGFIGMDGGSTVLQSASVLSATNTYTPGTRAMVSLATSALAAEKKASDQGSPVTLGIASAGKGTVTKLRVGAYSTGAFQLQGNVGPLYGWTRVPSQSESNAVSAP